MKLFCLAFFFSFTAFASALPQRPQFTPSIRFASARAAQIRLHNEFCGSANASLRFCVGYDVADGAFYIERSPKAGPVLLLPVMSHTYDNAKKIAYYMGMDLEAVAAFSFTAAFNEKTGGWIGTYQYANPLGNTTIEQYQFAVQKY